MFWIVLQATTAMAQQSAGTVTEAVTTHRDLNGRDVVSEKVVTHHARTNDEERVVIETYVPSIEAGRLALSQRSVTTVRKSGTDSYVSERQIFERDANGRLVLVHTQTEHTSRD
jgi:hypothetical protein